MKWLMLAISHRKCKTEYRLWISSGFRHVAGAVQAARSACAVGTAARTTCSRLNTSHKLTIAHRQEIVLNVKRLMVRLDGSKNILNAGHREVPFAQV
ncbi:hypothetical protein EVAR_52594_1 [Eumeta japonica]|uniref:Uncharacterized protein n=1 Tax=Eumeta variegata TaxID=151549 RepID=A0A4C1YL26_EUMVA|nr:hypothetical protein EVAR_52594_1 [Eumeta japonica]